MAGLLRTQERSPASGELFRLHCVGICGRPSNGQILLDHYRYKRRRFAGDERVCHQSMTAMCWPTARPKAPADERFRLSLAGSLKRRAPARLARSLREHMLRISDDALGAPASVCKFVAGRYCPSAQRRAKQRRSNASAKTSVRSHAQPIRLVNEAAGRQDQANLLRARPDFRLTINSPNDDGTTNSSSARARLKPLKTLA
jgi:hypothetical protein